jgi:hypothetical protein
MHCPQSVEAGNCGELKKVGRTRSFPLLNASQLPLPLHACAKHELSPLLGQAQLGGRRERLSRERRGSVQATYAKVCFPRRGG